MEEVIKIINSIMIFLSLLFVPYNYLYRSEVLQIKKQLGISPPKVIDNLLKVNILLPLLVIFIALLLLIFSG